MEELEEEKMREEVEEKKGKEEFEEEEEKEVKWEERAAGVSCHCGRRCESLPCSC